MAKKVISAVIRKTAVIIIVAITFSFCMIVWNFFIHKSFNLENRVKENSKGVAEFTYNKSFVILPKGWDRDVKLNNNPALIQVYLFFMVSLQ